MKALEKLKRYLSFKNVSIKQKHRDVAWEKLEHGENYPWKNMPVVVANDNTLTSSK